VISRFAVAADVQTFALFFAHAMTF